MSADHSRRDPTTVLPASSSAKAPGSRPPARPDNHRHPVPPEADHIDRALVWLRRDLRVDDQAALYHALRAARQVWCVFIFDRAILDPLPRTDRRVEFIQRSLEVLDGQLRALGGGLIVRHGDGVEQLSALASELHVQAVYVNHDYEPAARSRDAAARGALSARGIALYSYKDQVVFETDEVLTAAGTPFGVFTPYKNAWLKTFDPFYVHPYPVRRHAHKLAPPPAGLAGTHVPSLADVGFHPTDLPAFLAGGSDGAQQLLDDFLARMDDYESSRNFPAIKGPSYLSVHLRFGTVSIRQLAGLAHARSAAGSRGAAVWLSELIWRDFYMQVLHHHPRVVAHCFRPEYDALRWRTGRAAEALFGAWCEGRTGYPIVDAAMLQLNQTGYMHNRLRMIVASFLTKDLGIDWRRGEAYFARHLNDFDLAANNGGWQWAASTGCDAQPYFRIFNPVSQSEKFDPQGKFIRRYLPALSALSAKSIHAPWLAAPLELAAAGLVIGRDYPAPVVDHARARAETLERFSQARGPVKGAAKAAG